MARKRFFFICAPSPPPHSLPVKRSQPSRNWDISGSPSLDMHFLGPRPKLFEKHVYVPMHTLLLSVDGERSRILRKRGPGTTVIDRPRLNLLVTGGAGRGSTRNFSRHEPHRPNHRLDSLLYNSAQAGHVSINQSD